MARVIVTLKIMPQSPEVNLDLIKEQAVEKITKYGGEVGKTEIQPIAFGLNALIINVVMDENRDSEDFEKFIKEIPGVSQVDVAGMTRL